jgi:thioesterase domain-containing protein/acyl carrier protein
MTAQQPAGATAVADKYSLASSSSIQETLAVIFAQILRHGPVGEDDDFFDLGGDSLNAIELMAEIKEALGRDLPVTTIYDAPTIAALAALLASETPTDNSNLVLLRPGAGTRPLFIAHGLGGTVMELRNLASAIATDQAIYGIEAVGLDGKLQPLCSIPAMARFHVAAVRRIQPNGPYLLAGFSFGGLVAFEMAKILSCKGERIELLGLLDSFPHTRFWPLRARIASWGQLARFTGARSTLRLLFEYHRGVLTNKSVGAASIYILDRTWRALKLSVDIFRLGAWLQRFADFTGPTSRQPGPARDVTIPAALLRVQRAGETAYRAYRPEFYDGEITFIKADREMRIPFDARVLWGALARRVEVHTVASDHQNLVRANAPDLARLLTQCLGNTSAQSR